MTVTSHRSPPSDPPRRGDPFAPLIAAMGQWPAAALDEVQDAFRTTAIRLDGVRLPAETDRVHRLFAGRAAPWLLFGSELDERHALAVADLAYSCTPTLRLAVLGPVNNSDRAERWLRQGADVYLAEEAVTPDELVRALHVSGTGLVVVDRRCRDRRSSAGPALTTRQRETLMLLCAGLSNDAIARALRVNRRTVEFHVTAIFEKLGVRSRVEAALRARELGF